MFAFLLFLLRAQRDNQEQLINGLSVKSITMAYKNSSLNFYVHYPVAVDILVLVSSTARYT